MKILILEDDAIEAERLSRKVATYFQDKCEIVGPLSSFSEAVEAVRQKMPDIALVDIGLGDNLFGGVNFAESLQAFFQIPIIFLTGMNDPKILNETSKINFSDIIFKPWNEEGLFRALTKAKRLIDHPNTAGHRTYLMPNRQHKFWFRLEKGEYESVDFKNIAMVESDGHYQSLFISNKQPILIHGTLKTLYSLHFDCYDHFFLLGRRLIINSEYIFKVKGNDLVMNIDDKKETIRSIPRGWKKKIFNWLEIRENLPKA